MRIALVINARPRLFKASAITKLSAGTWRLSLAGVSDSVITVIHTLKESVVNMNAYHGMEITGPCYVEFRVATPGTEPSFSIYATRINDGNTGK